MSNQALVTFAHPFIFIFKGIRESSIFLDKKVTKKSRLLKNSMFAHPFIFIFIGIRESLI